MTGSVYHLPRAPKKGGVSWPPLWALGRELIWLSLCSNLDLYLLAG